MSIFELQPGDAVLAKKDIYNDGSFPDSEVDELLVKQGTQGMIIKQGHLEVDETQIIFLVSFETNSTTEPTGNANGKEVGNDLGKKGELQVKLGPPIGCWPEDLDLAPLPDD